ncbi:MAG: hypothetical protein AMK73_03780 [Planctomycetes bacterium SM23_32]|nr:MAG: hypothetical protein AMK73_03780 [Planctomycetes bacterium SM23_32]
MRNDLRDGGLRVLFAGGGSGGHLMPAAATAEAVRAAYPGSRAMFMLTDRRTDSWCRSAVSDHKMLHLPAVGRHSVGERLRLPFRSLCAAGRVADVVRSFRPHAVVGLGGSDCAVPVLAARALGVRTVLFEANAVPGRAVRLLAPLADLVVVQWARAAAGLRARRVLAAGMPVRARLFGVRRERALRRLGLSVRRRTLLVTGGSQGALTMNRALWEALGAIFEAAPDLQVLHLTGVDHLPAALEWKESLPVSSYRPIGFLDRMEDAYAAADLVVSRSGGSTLAELTALGLPAVLIPYPHHVDEHQQANAEVLSATGAAITISQSALTAGRLAATVALLAGNDDLLSSMAAASQRLGRPRAAFDVAAELGALAGLSRPKLRSRPDEDTLGKESLQAA